MVLTVAGACRETIAAVNRLVAARLKRNFGDAAALAARCLEHLALRTAVAAAAATATAASAARGFARCAAIRAPARFVGEAFAGVKFLLACGELERARAIDAIEVFICVHERVS